MSILPCPEHPGQYDGQCKTVEVKVPKLRNGRPIRFPYRAPNGQTYWMTVKETQCRVDWVWDHREREWVSESTWKARRPAPNAGKVLVSKHSDLHRQFAERQRRANKRRGKK